jgi:hypothetical protein
MLVRLWMRQEFAIFHVGDANNAYRGVKAITDVNSRGKHMLAVQFYVWRRRYNIHECLISKTSDGLAATPCSLTYLFYFIYKFKHSRLQYVSQPWEATLLCTLKSSRRLCYYTNILVQYGAYHHNPVNVAIHMICVPLIIFTAFLLVSAIISPRPELRFYKSSAHLPPTVDQHSHADSSAVMAYDSESTS